MNRVLSCCWHARQDAAELKTFAAPSPNEREVVALAERVGAAVNEHPARVRDAIESIRERPHAAPAGEVTAAFLAGALGKRLEWAPARPASATKRSARRSARKAQRAARKKARRGNGA